MAGADPGTRIGFPLRVATVEDAEAIARVHEASRAAAFREHLPPEILHSMPLEERIERWKEWLVADGAVTLVASKGEVIVGFGTLAPSPDEDADPRRVADMPTLYVHPDYWRRGIGRTLCESVITLARTHGYECLTLWTMETNEPARVFYESLGFEADGTSMADPGAAESNLLALRFGLDLRDGGASP